MPAKQALKGIDLQIPRGSIFGLLGPNGAGKSTFINILAGLVNKTAGSVSIWGIDADRQPRESRAALGVVPQEINMDPFFTPRETLELMAGFYGVPGAERRTDEILDALGLGDKKHAYVRQLSGGMKRRLMVAKAMVHSPPILILDEPTAGVDVELRRQLWEYVRRLNAQGVTIVLTTHYLEEAQEMCDQIAIVNHGQVVACEPTPKLLKRMNQKTLVVRPEQGLDAVPAALADLSPSLRKDGQLAITYKVGEQTIEHLLKRLREANVGIGDLATEEPDLEDVFVSLTS
ncbi:MAG: multidrug ABC transporter ATP-binding protein [Alphaproteobacteria bacterium 32-64-14]|nr:MAG: multidrug ABC transporter ATP-binding protein [Alphaproteobacteria bacterium 32-64-14]